MVSVGKTDAFEREYMQKFRAFAAKFGEFVNYERDRGVRDIGMHLTQKLQSGKERLSSALVWFQMKGIMATTLSEQDFGNSEEFSISLDVGHLRYWYLQPMPTYLVLYVESADTFLILNLSAYVDSTWGRDILTLSQSTATVKIPKDSILDDQAFNLLLQTNDIEQWKKALGTDNEGMGVCYRDYNLIWHLGTAEERGVSHEMEFWDWQSKTRSQIFIRETNNGDTETLREHWQYSMSIDDLQVAYPHFEFYPLDDEDDEDWWDDDDEYVPRITLPNGDVVVGVDAASEYFAYDFGLRLNDAGREMFEWVLFLAEVGLIEIDPDKREHISVAPWHGRAV